MNAMPDDVTVDDIIEKIYYELQIDEGLKELDDAKGIPHDTMKERLSKWLTR